MQIVYDDFTDRSRGFAFVTMGNVEDAEEAIRMFDGTVSLNCLLHFNFYNMYDVWFIEKNEGNHILMDGAIPF